MKDQARSELSSPFEVVRSPSMKVDGLPERVVAGVEGSPCIEKGSEVSETPAAVDVREREGGLTVSVEFVAEDELPGLSVIGEDDVGGLRRFRIDELKG